MGWSNLLVKFLHPVFQREDIHSLSSPAMAYINFQTISDCWILFRCRGSFSPVPTQLDMLEIAKEAVFMYKAEIPTKTIGKANRIFLNIYAKMEFHIFLRGCSLCIIWQDKKWIFKRYASIKNINPFTYSIVIDYIFMLNRCHLIFSSIWKQYCFTVLIS